MAPSAPARWAKAKRRVAMDNGRRPLRRDQSRLYGNPCAIFRAPRPQSRFLWARWLADPASRSTRSFNSILSTSRSIRVNGISALSRRRASAHKVVAKSVLARRCLNGLFG